MEATSQPSSVPQKRAPLSTAPLSTSADAIATVMANDGHKAAVDAPANVEPPASGPMTDAAVAPAGTDESCQDSGDPPATADQHMEGSEHLQMESIRFVKVRISFDFLNILGAKAFLL